MRRTLTGRAALIVALVAVPAVRPAEPAAASLGPAYRDAHLGLQTGAVVVMSSGDISPPTNETKVVNVATMRLLSMAWRKFAATLSPPGDAVMICR